VFDTQAPSVPIGRDYSDNTRPIGVMRERIDQMSDEVPAPTTSGQHGRHDAMTRFLPPGSASIADFERLDIRVGRIVTVALFPAARTPAYRLTIDFGSAGTRRSSAQLPATYPDPSALVGRLVIAVVNFAPRNIAGFISDVLVLGALPHDGRIPLLGVDEGAMPGDRVG
jgi:tRNA-binding protein